MDRLAKKELVYALSGLRFRRTMCDGEVATAFSQRESLLMNSERMFFTEKHDVIFRDGPIPESQKLKKQNNVWYDIGKLNGVIPDYRLYRALARYAKDRPIDVNLVFLDTQDILRMVAIFLLLTSEGWRELSTLAMNSIANLAIQNKMIEEMKGTKFGHVSRFARGER